MPEKYAIFKFLDQAVDFYRANKLESLVLLIVAVIVFEAVFSFLGELVRAGVRIYFLRRTHGNDANHLQMPPAS
jgi:hypothetical protein